MSTSAVACGGLARERRRCARLCIVARHVFVCPLRSPRLSSTARRRFLPCNDSRRSAARSSASTHDHRVCVGGCVCVCACRLSSHLLRMHSGLGSCRFGNVASARKPASPCGSCGGIAPLKLAALGAPSRRQCLAVGNASQHICISFQIHIATSMLASMLGVFSSSTMVQKERL